MPERHLTQHELVLLMEASLGSPHLDACAFCRTRLAEMESALSAFSDVYAERQLPPANLARALLRQSLRERSRQPQNNWWLPACVAAAFLFVVAFYNRPADHSEPRNNLTPGEIRTVSLGDVCGNEENGTVRTVPVSMRQQVFREYGINDLQPAAYEVDYLITPELGGANSIRNLWPEPYSAVWNAHVKDELEERLHGMVCAGEIDLPTAQREISRDWIAAYKKYFHTDKP